MFRSIFKSKLMIAIIPTIIGALAGYHFAQLNIQAQKDIARNQNESSIIIANNQTKATQDNWEKQYQITAAQIKLKEQESDFIKLKETFIHMNNLRTWYFDNYLSISLARLQFNDIPPSDKQFYINELARIQSTADNIRNQLNSDIPTLDSLVNKNAEYYNNQDINSAKDDFLNNIYSSNFIMSIDENELANFYKNQLLKATNPNNAYNITRNEYYKRFQEHTKLTDSFQKLSQLIQEGKSKSQQTSK